MSQPVKLKRSPQKLRSSASKSAKLLLRVYWSTASMETKDAGKERDDKIKKIIEELSEYLERK